MRNNCVFDILSDNFHSLLLDKIVLRFEIVCLYNLLLADKRLGSSHCFLVLQLSSCKLIEIPPDSCVLLVFTDIVSLALSHSFHIQPFLLFHFSFLHKVVGVLLGVDHLLNSQFHSLLMLNSIPSDSVEDIGFLGQPVLRIIESGKDVLLQDLVIVIFFLLRLIKSKPNIDSHLC